MDPNQGTRASLRWRTDQPSHKPCQSHVKKQGIFQQHRLAPNTTIHAIFNSTKSYFMGSVLVLVILCCCKNTKYEFLIKYGRKISDTATISV